jgi:hypothetical protein
MLAAVLCYMVARVAVAVAGPEVSQGGSGSEVSFSRDIQPILAKRCFVCHHLPSTNLRKWRAPQQSTVFDTPLFRGIDFNVDKLLADLNEMDSSLMPHLSASTNVGFLRY